MLEPGQDLGGPQVREQAKLRPQREQALFRTLRRRIPLRPADRAEQDRIVAMCNRAIEEDGADTIMLGCTCMSPIAREIAARVKVPVLNPLTTGYKATEMALALDHVHSVEAYRPVGGSRDEQYTAIAQAVTALDVADPRGKQAAE